MKNIKNFSVGDKIIKFNKVYIIFKIIKQQIKDKTEKIISCKPFFKTERKNSLTLSIPVENLDKTNIRKPISKKELKRLLTELSKTSDREIPIDLEKINKELNLKDPNIHIEVLKCLWKEKNDETISFTKTRSNMLGSTIKLLLEEVALVSGISLKEAEQKIKKALKKSL